MNFEALNKMPDKDALKLFHSIPNPPYLESINTDPDSFETLLNDFSNMKISPKERDALRDDLNRARGYSPDTAKT